MPSGTRDRGYLADGLVLGSICLVFIVRCTLRAGWVMWIDELFSFNLIHDPSVTHMLAALGDQADGAPPVYYLLAKGWAAVFTDSPASLRLFSATGFCGGFTLLWITVRRAYSLFPTALAFVVTVGLNVTIEFESSNIRFYGLLFTLISLSALLAVRLCESEHASRRLLVANALTQGTLVLSHPLGGFYGAAIMFAVGTSDLLRTPPRLRLSVLASYCVGWLAIFLWWRQFFRQAAISAPRGLIPAPTINALFKHFLQQSTVFPLLLLLALCSLASLSITCSSKIRLASSLFQLSGSQRAPLLIALSLISIAPLFWLLSHFLPSKSVFWPRYLIGTTLGWTILFANLTALLFERVLRMSPSLAKGIAILIMTAVSVTFFAAPMVCLLGGTLPDARLYLSGTSDGSFGYLGLPIVCPGAQEFLARTHYALDAGGYYYLLNWTAASDPESIPGMMAENHMLSAIKRNYADFKNIVDASEFLRNHSVFLVLDVPEFRWCFYNLGSNSYKVTRLKTEPPVQHDHMGEWPLLLVERMPCSRSANPAPLAPWSKALK